MRLVVDPYKDFNRSYERLESEYEEHGRLIIAVDFDDTVYNTHKHEGWCYSGVIETLIRWNGHAEIIAWSASNPDRYELIRNTFNAFGINLSGINCNAPGIEQRGPKIYANVYLDDRTFGLEMALRALNLLADVKGL